MEDTEFFYPPSPFFIFLYLVLYPFMNGSTNLLGLQLQLSLAKGRRHGISLECGQGVCLEYETPHALAATHNAGCRGTEFFLSSHSVW